MSVQDEVDKQADSIAAMSLSKEPRSPAPSESTPVHEEHPTLEPDNNYPEVLYDAVGLPRSLLDWRNSPANDWNRTISHIWLQFRDFFRAKGYELFEDDDDRSGGLRPKQREEVRAQDMFHAVVMAHQAGEHNVVMRDLSNKHWAATRLQDGAHVLMHLVCKAGQGYNELAILRRFSRPELRIHPDNHVIPLLDEIEIYDMVFAVVPYLGEPMLIPPLHNDAERLEAMVQTFKGLAFMHENLVAHLDIGPADIIHNYGGSSADPAYAATLEAPDGTSAPFRELFHIPCRYYFVDFEMSYIADWGSEPLARTLRGHPCALQGRITQSSEYGKATPPEWLLSQPYCPFKSDVWQLGRLWKRYLRKQRNISAALGGLLDCMTDGDPCARPKMSDAVQMLSSCLKSGTTASIPSSL